MAKQKKTRKRNPDKLGPKQKDKKTKPEKKTEQVADKMTHVQVISVERALTTKEIAESGGELAKEELMLDQVRKEKKETNKEYDDTIKNHVSRIMQLSQAIDTGILTTNVECDVVIDREKETKTCYPKDGGESFTISMTKDDFDLLT
jgi:hypothetical protein